MINFLFYLSILILFYTYFGYPLLLSILKRVKKRVHISKKNVTPKVSIVISAYNEESAIRNKLYNILSLDYPKDRMEIVVISDASTDRTDEVVKSFASDGVKLCRLRKRSGKVAAYRKVFRHLEGEIVVFSDATSYLNKDCIRHLVGNFNDPMVGCVGGLLKFVNPRDDIVGNGESRYWQYEKKIKEYESSLCSLSSVSGTLYAVRKYLYPYKTIKDFLADDLIVPLEVKRKGLRTVLEPNAICKEFTTLSVKHEMAKRIRITIQNIGGLINQFEILNPFKYGLYSLLIVSHKLLRVAVPAFLLVLFISNIILAYGSWVYSVILTLQIIFYLAGFSGYFLSKGVKVKLVNSVFYFCLSNLAILIGIVQFIAGVKIATWQTIRTKI